ncbi:MAG: elongation factor P maturation arginine rhamnosyltransferase EarP, partial [Polaromonas sp.]|nr:elongation factor P maturation arginine rhamnosyltransferase EarP [Polaromonas sp.]
MPGRLQWDIFCKVIDNFGDIGVCWRLSADLADRGHRVRLWLDDASALQWMAPGGWAGVQVLQWADPLDLSPADLQAQPCNVLVEAFGCAVATEFIAAYARSDWSASQKPVWINLEYLSAEAYAGRSHALPSPVAYGPGAGATKWFFYPGFTSETGGLLRELSLSGQQDAFDADAWLARFGGAREDAKPERHISLFCYEPPLLRALLEQLAASGLHGAPVRLMVTAGRASAAVRGILKTDR